MGSSRVLWNEEGAQVRALVCMTPASSAGPGRGRRLCGTARHPAPTASARSAPGPAWSPRVASAAACIMRTGRKLPGREPSGAGAQMIEELVMAVLMSIAFALPVYYICDLHGSFFLVWLVWLVSLAARPRCRPSPRACRTRTCAGHVRSIAASRRAYM